VVVVGTTFRFGHRRQGDLEALRRLGAEMGFRVRGIDPVTHEGAPVSSTRIREALARGAVEAAAALLGRRFSIDGRIVAGAGRGRSLGIPTANLAPDNETLPGGGVYAGWCRVLETAPAEPLPAVVNVGHRPTFGGGATVVEAHLLGFEGDLYGRRVRVEFQTRLREERRFSGAEELAAQIRRDVQEAGRLLGGA
jgi:riboflavin kinase/FMN adenylyltransferase